jgi:phosphoribosyl 1,2-cyclic phosphodiesterase
LPIFANAQTAEAMKLINRGEHRTWRVFATGSEFSIEGIIIQSFPVPHDAVELVGFVLHHDDASLGFCPDLGSPRNWCWSGSRRCPRFRSRRITTKECFRKTCVRRDR